MQFKWEAYFFLPERKFPQENGISWKVVQNFQPEFSERKMCVPFAIFTSSKLYSNFDACHVLFSRGCANGTRQSWTEFFIGIFAYHLYKPSANRFSHVNGKQPLSSAKRDDDDTSIHIGITLFVLNHHLGSF